MKGTQLALSFDAPAPPAPIASTERQKALDILAAIRTLKALEAEQRAATPQEGQALARFGGFGAVALRIFPDPVKGTYKDGWQPLGEELKELLTPEEYASAKRTTFNAFYTAATVMQAIHQAIGRLGVPEDATVLEPGCGCGRFMTGPHRYIGVELDSISGRIARLLHPQADIRIENFRDTKLPPLDAVIGNVPFADVKMEHNGQKFSLHDFFIAKATDSLKPGGVLAVVTSHFTLNKQNAAAREYLAERADFLGAIRLPSDAFKREGTSVVTDIVFLRKRGKDEVCKHCDPEWIQTGPLCIEGTEVAVNKYFLNHPEMVLGNWTSKDTLYGEGYSVTSNGNLAEQLREAVERLPRAAAVSEPNQHVDAEKQTKTPFRAPAAFTPPPPLKHIDEGSFFVRDGTICQVENGNATPVVYGGSTLTAYRGIVGKRLSGLVGLRDRARRVLQSQNEGWPEENRQEARRELNRAYDLFAFTYGPINKTTFSESKDGTLIRRMPNIVKFREDPDAMLVMSLEEYDEVTGKATKAAIMQKDVVGQKPPVTTVRSAEEGLLVSLDQKGAVDLPFISSLYGKPEKDIIAELGDLIYHDPESKAWQTADAYLSGNVRAKLKTAEAAGYTRNADALRAVQPEDVLPGDIDANLGAPWIPESDIQAFAADLFKVEPSSITVGHLPKDAVWSIDADYAASHSVAAMTEYGTPRINGATLLELALNMRTPTIYDPDPNDPDKRVVNNEETLAAKEKQKQIKEKFKAWVFTDPERTEKLVRIYNDTYNNLRPRLFDGSHLEFPGMNQTIKLNPHQVNAIWRIMTGGNTLLAHCVGAGKSFEIAAAAMKMGQTGLLHKPLVTVPNHLLEQFAREFQQLYPNAKLLVAGKDDFTKERRKRLTAKIASGDWDAIIVTHSSFERIAMSKEYQEQFLQEQIDEYNQLLVDGAKGAAKAHRNLLKTIEKQKAKREEKLKDLMAEDKKDSGLVFDELGVDHLFVDECFPYDTLLETDQGLLKIGDIVSNRILVSLRTWNKQTLMLEWKPIVNWFANKRRTQLIEVSHEHGSFICTPNHKLWIEGVGYKEAGKLTGNENLLILSPSVYHRMQSSQGMSQLPACQAYANGAMRMVQGVLRLCVAGADPRRQPTTQVLQQPMQGTSPASQSGDRSQIQSGYASCMGQLALQGAEESWSIGMDESKPIRVSAGNSPENLSGTITQKEPPCSALLWGQRQATSTPAITPRRSDGDAHGVCNQDSPHSRSDRQAAALLQSGLSRSGTQTRNRSGRLYPLVSQSQGTRRQERQGPIPSRVVSVKVLEPGSDGEYRFGGRTHQVVYDIEVADNHNYFANGVLVSNCQAYKNLEAPSKMERVAGISTGGSERAFDLFMKARYLHQKHPGHGLTGASGTPISNSMVEMYTMQRYFDPEGLRQRGIDHLDAWAATYGEVVDTMEISPDGKTLKPRSRFAKFNNIPELQQQFRSFADVQTAEMLNLPRPALETGKPIVVACPMSEEQHAIQDHLVERYDRIRSSKVDPREDNALAITTDGRKLALDARMLSETAPDFPGSKINALAENVAAIWKKTEATRGTQMVFCDMGVNPTGPGGFSAYDEVIRKLIEHGIPRAQIASIGDADSDAKKLALFEKVRAGSIRVLIGSTQKMGTGTNVQKRLVALHHLDAPWKPAEVEQREGRILRQGNENKEVAIYRYVTEGSFDAYMWQALETKARFIAQIMTGDSVGRRAEDIGGQELSYAEVKALASGNPAFLVLAEADAEVQRLNLLKRNHADEQYLARRRLRELPDSIESQKQRLANLEADKETAQDHADDPITIGNRQGEVMEALGDRLEALPRVIGETRKIQLGKYRGLKFGLVIHPYASPEAYLEGTCTRTSQMSREHHGPRAVMNALERLVNGYPFDCKRTREDLGVMEGQLRDYKARLGQPFAHTAYLDELTALRDQLKAGLAGEPKEGEPSVADLAEKIKQLRAANTVEAAPQRAAKKVSAQEPVTATIRRRAEEPGTVVDDADVASTGRNRVGEEAERKAARD